MTTTPFCPALPRDKIPKDGPGPRGVPDCYYVSRALNSTFHYAHFVKKMRATEDEYLKYMIKMRQDEKDQQINDFFSRNERRTFINVVSNRVDLCWKAYENDLQKKRDRLNAILLEEEESNIRDLVLQVQNVEKATWEEKRNRLQFLVEKRNKEHAEKYKDQPLTKCTHVHPCIVQRRKGETQEMQLYQIHEKQSRKMQEKEFDKMWHEMGMKESDALAARIEIDVMKRHRQDMECKKHNDLLIAQREKQREIDRETLKKEQLALKAQFEADTRKTEQEEQERHEKEMKTARSRKEDLKERHAMAAKKAEADALIEQTWTAVATQNKADDNAKLELMKKKRRDLDACNKKMIELKEQLADSYTNEKFVNEIIQKNQEEIDRKRCDYVHWQQKITQECQETRKGQVKERAKAREEIKNKIKIEEEYRVQLQKQLDQLAAYKLMEEAKTRKLHQQDLVKQMQYTQLLKDRALQEELEQRKKAAIAAKEYQDEINAMVNRPYYSEHIHPFLKEMDKLKDDSYCYCRTNHH